jgi:hypothetical protein
LMCDSSRMLDTPRTICVALLVFPLSYAEAEIQGKDA